MSMISDRKLPIEDAANPGTIAHYEADLLSATDYYPFGDPMPGRQYNSGNYRYGFNEKENDNEVKGTGAQQDYGMRIYDNRLGRFLSIDPLTKSFPMLTPYQFASNSPIANIDLDGMEAFYFMLSKNDGNTSLNVVGATTVREAAGFKYTPEKSYTVFYNDQSYSFGNGTGLNNIGFKSSEDAFNAFIKNPDDKRWITDKAADALKDKIETIYKGVGLISNLLKTPVVAKNQKPNDPPKPKYGDLTEQEVEQIQGAVDEAGRPIEVGGSAASGTRRGVGTDLPIGKGPGTKSDIDYFAPPSSFKYFEKSKLPDVDPQSGIIPGQGNPNIGPYIRFEPNSEPTYIPKAPQ